MIIGTYAFLDIVKTVLKEQDLTLISNPNRSELYKRLLLYLEYTSRYYALIKEHIASLPPAPSPLEQGKAVSLYIKTLVSDAEYLSLVSSLTSIAGKNIPEYSKILPIIQHSLSLFTKFATNFDDTLPDDVQTKVFNEFTRDFQLFDSSLSKLLTNIRSKFEDSPSSNVNTKAVPEVAVVTSIGELEKLAMVYFSEIEILFKKFDNMRIEAGEYSKKWEEFNLLRGHNFFMKGMNPDTVGDKDEFSSKTRRAVSDYFKKRFRQNTDVLSKTPYSFDPKIFLEIMYTATYKHPPGSKNYPTREISKAKSIQSSLTKLFGWNTSTSSVAADSIEGMLKGKLKEIHDKLWDPTAKAYKHDAEIKQIFQILFNVRTLYKSTLNKVVTTMESLKDKEMSEKKKKNGPILDAIIKYVQFAKLNMKNVYLALISNSGVKIDVARYQSLFSKQNDEVLSKRLAYWALFQRLGWTKGLKDEEAPSWLYGNTIEKPESSPASTPSPTPAPVSPTVIPATTP